MRSTWRALLAFVACGLVGLVSWSTVARAEGALTVAQSGSSVLSNPTVVVGSPEEAQELQYERESSLHNPEVVMALEASRTEFEGLDSVQAAKLDGEAFSRLVEAPAGGAPELPVGQRIVAYTSANTARLELPDDESAVLESLSPIAIETSSGTRVPIDLSLGEVGDGFQPARSLVGVDIPKHLADGISLSDQDVSLTPVDAQGESLAGAEGSLVGASVLYANSLADTDTLVKPTTNGFDVDALLRSVESPEELYFRVGMPAGAQLVSGGQGGANVIVGGQTIASVLSPVAQDAAGSSVPVSMSVSGDLLTVSVDHRAGSYQYPIDVDPSVIDSQLTKSGAKRANWEFSSEPVGSTKFGDTNAACKGPGEQYLETCATGEYKEGEFAVWVYQTRGNSKIFEFKGETEAENTSAKIESRIELQDGGTTEEYERLSTEFKEPKYSQRPLPEPLCPKGKTTCTSSYGGEKNAVHFQQSVTASGGSKFSDYLFAGEVSISEPNEHATTKFNTTSPELEGEVINVKSEKEKIKRKNVMDSGGWLSEHDGAAELISEDKGIGVSATQLEFESSPGKWEQIAEHNYLTEEDLCKGYQCEPKDEEFWLLSPKLPNGEDKIRYRAEDGMGVSTESGEGEGVATVKVDTAKPRKLRVGGLPYGNELSERPYQLTVEATDGEGTTVASPGIESIALYIDDGLIGTNGGTGGKEGTEGKCSEAKGECTASAKWTFNGAELGAGKHQIEIVARDRAGNEERFYDPISIRHSTPVSMGPGSVDLESGDYTLGATDVSMGSGLTVSRAYSSRALEQGEEGSLGPQWNLTVGDSSESLVELVDHSMMLTGNNGRQTIFAYIEPKEPKTEPPTYESPTGDSNLTLKLEENKETKIKEAFYLENAADHTKVKFTLPSGDTKEWVPTKQEGTVATDTVTYAYKSAELYTEFSLSNESRPESITAGPDGKLWFADKGTNTIGTVALTGQIHRYGSGVGVTEPEEIITGPNGNLWLTSGGYGRTLTEMKTSGEQVRGANWTLESWGSIYTEHPVRIAPGPGGDVWYILPPTHQVGKITPSGTMTNYALPAESVPDGLTSGVDGYVWVTESAANKVVKINSSGTTVAEYSLPEKSEPRAIAEDEKGDVWFQEFRTKKVGKITPSGTITEYPLAEGASFTGHSLVDGSDGNMWFAESGNKVDKITMSGTITRYTVQGENGISALTPGPDGNIWFAATGSSKGSVGIMPTSGLSLEPTEALAPKPAGVSCGPELKAGCRALKFQYATKTTAAGENSSQWGQFKGRLEKILSDAYNPVSKKMEEIAVAEYRYDQLGRLRAEWDPRVSPALKSTYGYDAEGHVTAMTAPGKESWVFAYDAIAGDAGTGRLLKATQAPASTALWGGELPSNTSVPKVSGSGVVGVRLAVSDGVWSNSPVAYAYQWEDCNTKGEECTPIVGAVDPNYTPVQSDIGHTLVGEVTATNGGGSVVAVSAASATVTTNDFVQTVDHNDNLDAVSCISGTTQCAVSDSNGNLFYATNVSASGVASWSAWSGPGTSPSEALDCVSSSLCLLTDGEDKGYGGNLYYATSFGGPFSLAYSPGTGVDAISCASSSFCVDGQDNGGYFRYSTSPASSSWTLEQQGSASMRGVSCLSSSFCAIVDGAGSVHVATSTSQIESSSWTSTDVDDTNALNGVACTSTTSCLAVDGAGSVLNLTVAGKGEATVTRHNIDAANSLTAITCTTSSTCVMVDNQGNLFVSTNNGGTWSEKYTLGDDLTSVSCASSSLCATVDTTGNLTAFNPTGSSGSEGEPRAPQPGSTIDYGVPLEGPNAPAQMGENPTTHRPETEQWGQAVDVPVEATSISPPDSPQGWPASSYTHATTYYLDEEGRLVNVESPSNGKYGSISTSEYNEESDVTRTLTPDNRATALEAGEKSLETATLLSTFNTYKDKCSKESEFNEERETSEFGTRLCETEGPEHTVKYIGSKGQEEGEARDHVRYFYDEKVPSEGPSKESFSKETFNLVTETQNLTEILGNKGRVEQEIEPRTTITSYSGENNLGWKLRAPTSVTTDTEIGGQKLKSTTLYNEAGQVTETRSPGGEGGNSAHDAKIVYYTSENEAEVANCRKHPEWAGLVCQTLPAKQPETSGVPNPPVTETTYNMWDEPETATETFTFAPHPTAVRTRKDAYDGAGRLTSSETTVTGNEDKTLPKVTYEYESKQGMLDAESATISGKTKTVTNKFNTLGQLAEYADASGENTAKYVYGGPEKNFQVEEVNDSSNGAKSRQTYGYNETTMQLETLWDSAAETFTASYDTEGKLTSEIYPNGMCANYTYNSVGEATHLEYIKTTNCSEKSAPVWYNETVGANVRGEILNRTSSLATQNYTYDTLGRLTETQETPAGGECSVRLYEYEKESNRTKLTSRKPGSKGECATTGGTEEKHTYDEANRMTDTGIEYEGLGNITKLPATDAEGHELKSTFYTDGTVATQTQNGITNEYGLEPDGRILTTTTGGKTTINHYDGAGETVAWACEAATGTETCETGRWTRNIPGIDGTLAAVQTNGGTPVLQLHDLKGNVVATAELSSGASKLLSTYSSTEFGVPNNEKTPPPFAWLGAADVSKSLSSGVITYGATSYVPQTGRTLQTVPVESPGYPTPIGGGTYATFTAEPWNMQGGARVETEAPGIAAAEAREAWEAALKKALAEEQDPVFHYRAWEAKDKAKEVNHDLAIGNILEAVGVFAGSLDEAADRAIKSLWSESVVARWAGEAEEYLGFCVNTLHSDKDSHGGCRMLFYDMFWEGSEVPNFFEKPVISYCLKMTSDTAEVSECTLEKFENEVYGVEASQ